MNELTEQQTKELAQRMSENKERLIREIRQAAERSGNERFVDLAGAVGDAGDASVADLLRHVTSEEIRRDVLEVRDIVAAEERLAAGTYGICVECSAPIGYARLSAYPTAKRCLRCQQQKERTTGHYGPRSSL